TDEVRARLVGIAITHTVGEGCYIPLTHGQPAPMGGQKTLFDLVDTPPAAEPVQLDLPTVQAELAPILQDPAITKYMHNAKFDMTVLERHGLPIAPPIFDTMIASWLGNNAEGARHGLKDLVKEKLHIQMTEISELIGKGKKQGTMDRVSIEKVTPYAAADVDMTLRLVEHVKKPLEEVPALMEIFQKLELPLIFVLKDMELAGIRLDVDVLKQMSAQLQGRLAELEQEIHHQAGVSFNLNSTQQLSDVLFGRLGLPTAGLKKTKSGHYSTAAGVLESLRGQHPIIELMLEHRTVAKLLNTYVDALPSLVNPETGRIHTNYNQIGISTGRLSSSNPNLQNIPIRTEQGREIRRAFVAEAGHRLISADYSQVELRILAHIAQDEGLLNAFANDEDIHASTAAAVLGIPIEQVDKYQRRIAKTVNFGLIYGQTAYGLARSTGMSREEARAFIETYFEKYPGIRRYIEETKKKALEQGYVETLLGRRRDFSGLGQLSGPRRNAAEREAINMPIQGTAADIMKLAMINLHRRLREEGYHSRILLQVHDELVLEAPEAEVHPVAALTREVMANAYRLRVPLKVDVEIGQNWLDMEKFSL
ncbi:MAG: DNA polymerase I, partial [Chloroflexi bacterium]